VILPSSSKHPNVAWNDPAGPRVHFGAPCWEKRVRSSVVPSMIFPQSLFEALFEMDQGWGTKNPSVAFVLQMAALVARPAQEEPKNQSAAWQKSPNVACSTKCSDQAFVAVVSQPMRQLACLRERWNLNAAWPMLAPDTSVALLRSPDAGRMSQNRTGAKPALASGKAQVL